MLFNPGAKHVLFVGGGGFSGPKYFLKTYPNITVDVAEIDPVVIDVAQKYFNVTNSPRLNIYNHDARDFLTKTSNNQKYDIIILDAFSKNYVPFPSNDSAILSIIIQQIDTAKWSHCVKSGGLS